MMVCGVGAGVGGGVLVGSGRSWLDDIKKKNKEQSPKKNISTASSLLLFFGTRLRRQNFNLAPTQYRQLRRLVFSRS